jgi:formate hydrogenlyase subunit 4
MIMELLTTIAGVVLITLFGIIAGLFLMGVDRICAARMQMRQGPPLTQPFTDIRKLLCKDSVVPANAIPSLFNAAPIVAFASAVTVLFYLPLGSILPVGTPLPMIGEYGDLILIMYLLTVPALAMVAGGFASGSPYASVGAQREMVTMIAYEFPLAIAIVAIAWRLAVEGLVMPFSVNTLAANPIWTVVGPVGIIGCILLLIVLAWVTLLSSPGSPVIPRKQKPNCVVGFWSSTRDETLPSSPSPWLRNWWRWQALRCSSSSPGISLRFLECQESWQPE